MKRVGCSWPIAASLSLLTGLAAGCSPDDDDLSEDEMGSLEVPLTSTGDDGSLYELSGTLTVTGPAGTETFDLGGADTFETRVPPGQYTVELSSFVVSQDGAPLSDAVLSSPNPQEVAIRPRVPATVVFRFVRGGGLIVDFSVDEQAFWIAGEFTVGKEFENPELTSYLDPTGLFVQYTGVSIGYFILFDNLTSVGFFESSNGNKIHQYVAEGVHVSFDGDPHGVFTGDIGPDLDNSRLTLFTIRVPSTGATAAYAASTPDPQDHSSFVCLGYTALPVDGAGYADLVPFTTGEIAPFPACVVAHVAADAVTHSQGMGLASSFDFAGIAPP